MTVEVLQLQRMHLHAAGELGHAQVCEAEGIVHEAQVGVRMEAGLAQHLVAVLPRQEVLAAVGEQVVEDQLVAAEVDRHVGLARPALVEPQAVVAHHAVQVQVAGVDGAGEVLDAQGAVGDQDVHVHIVEAVGVVLRLHAEVVDEEFADGQGLVVEQAAHAGGHVQVALKPFEHLILCPGQGGVVREQFGQAQPVRA